MKLLRVVSPYFVAGVVEDHGVIVKTAPILAWSRGQSIKVFIWECQQRGWEAETLNTKEVIMTKHTPKYICTHCGHNIEDNAAGLNLEDLETFYPDIHCPICGRNDFKKEKEVIMTEFNIIIYTNGSCLGNPGPMGIGVILKCDDRIKEISKNLGDGTNNIAEISAVVAGLQALCRPEGCNVELHTDSGYVEGLLVKGWQAHANVEQVGLMRGLAARCKSLIVVKVKGHNGDALNERCDELAKAAAAE